MTKVKLATVVQCDPKAPYSIATTPSCWRRRYSFFWMAPLNPFLIMLCVKQGSSFESFVSHDLG